MAVPLISKLGLIGLLSASRRDQVPRAAGSSHARKRFIAVMPLDLLRRRFTERLTGPNPASRRCARRQQMKFTSAPEIGARTS